jgi:hypothetical protein
MPEFDNSGMPTRRVQRKAQSEFPSRQGQVPAMRMSKDEARWLAARKRELRTTWLAALYRGLGVRREDYLASRKSGV